MWEGIAYLKQEQEYDKENDQKYEKALGMKSMIGKRKISLKGL